MLTGNPYKLSTDLEQLLSVVGILWVVILRRKWKYIGKAKVRGKTITKCYNLIFGENDEEE